MLAYTYAERGRFALVEKEKPALSDAEDAIVRVTLTSVCTSDLHIKHGSVPRARVGVTVGHELVGVVESVGPAVQNVRPGDRVAVNVETYCGRCFFCEHGFVNNCSHPEGGWAIGCRIDGGQAEYVRIPLADQGLTRIPDGVRDEQALFVGDLLATGYWAARIGEIGEGDTILILGAGPTGLCTLQCARLHRPKRIIVCEKDTERRAFAAKLCPEALVVPPEGLENFVQILQPFPVLIQFHEVLRNVNSSNPAKCPDPKRKLLQLKSAGIKLIILAFLRNQLLMAAPLDDPSQFQNHDHI